MTAAAMRADALAPANFELSSRLPAMDEVESARQLHEPFARYAEDGRPIMLTLDDGETHMEISLAPAVALTLANVLDHFRKGRAVTLVPVGADLSTQQAADLLNVSRPYLIKLIDKGELSCIRVGRHRRLNATEVLAYRRRRDDARFEALDEMIESAGEDL